MGAETESAGKSGGALAKKDADRKCDPQDRVWDKDMSRGLSS